MGRIYYRMGKLLAHRLNRFILPTEAVQASAIRQAAHLRIDKGKLRKMYVVTPQ